MLANKVFCLDDLDNLPVFPAVAERLFAISESDEIDSGELSSVIEQDPALTAKILQIANSPLNALQRKVEHLHHAVNMLGILRVLSISISVTLTKAMKAGKYPKSFDYDYFFRRSLVAAAAAKSIGRGRVVNADLEPLFVAGVLQDIGQLVFVLSYGESYLDQIGENQRNHSALSDIEIQRYTDDHSSVGAWLLKEWELPSRYCMAVKYSHVLDRNLHPNDFTACVAASSLLAEYWLDSETDRSVSILHSKTALANLLDLSNEEIQVIFERMSDQLREIALCFNDQSLFEYNEQRREDFNQE